MSEAEERVVECPVCGHESTVIWRCEECGKLLDGERATGYNRGVDGS